ncbi:MAG: peptide deformylase [Ignavibacteriae bacterium HGW-Ignavibacteriae-1]|jgi:peptide deformylase|nr:MAG: peptide deformylase [Ignavibacteriae bacterium HGW-Ignavibacteriae-1]
MIIPIYNCFHPILRQEAQEVTEFNQRVSDLVANMYDTLYNISNGVGLAGNQVGSNDALFIVDLNVGSDEKKPNPITIINPEIISYSDEESEESEGCLSIPEFFEKVVRPDSIQIRYYDLDMKEYNREVSGFLARVMQHEFDHLNGKLIFDKITPLRRALAKSKLNKIKRGDLLPNYPMIMPDGSLIEPEIEE